MAGWRPSLVGKLGAAAAALSVPDHVAILGLGPSLEAYVDVVKRIGNRKFFADEVWGLNAAADVIQCDRVFHMDDVRIQELRAAAAPESNIAAMLQWLKKHPGPIYTSRAHPNYPGLVEFPLADVMNTCGGLAYFNGTTAYAVAFAIHLGVKKITLFGCDFSYANSHQAEQGRACVEFYLGMFRARGGVIGLPNTTSLMDAVATNGQRLYGYDTLDVSIEHDKDEKIVLAFTEREKIPTAEEIEKRYDHSQPTSPHVRAAIAQGAKT
jgi:hypothetical protein